MRKALSEAELREYIVALEGESYEGHEVADDNGGCRGTARSEVTRALPEADLTEAQWALIPDLTGSPEVVSAREQWRACMFEAGYEVGRSPSAALDLAMAVQAKMPSDAFSAWEQDLAVADVDCLSVTLWPAYAELSAPALTALVDAG